VTDSIGGSIDEKVGADSSRAKRSDLLHHIFPDLLLVLLFFERFGQTSFKLLSAEHLPSFCRCVFGFDLLLSNFFLIGTRLAVAGRGSLLFLCYAL